ncbi:lysophospholipid acyltransferase family protein [Vallicoccus soli]|uniref:1-acyl-sn-glycerol-3-phosphate acyltransferase n=1 Tax=Vallicoccus soli TaxID=2339232 RepID=A0A3A3Z2M6_9ACTN|nr:lysophospholipid acyltransferase family protein [Vallicoccus soli]RJK96939.1 1-acyl-sn-glycerol-3-phosphate acyltransferase [Vallicoccus soli]
MELVYPPVIGLARSVFALQGLRFTLRGTEHVPREGGAVMACNHLGYMDFTYVGLAARPAGRYVRFMAKREVFDHRVAGPLMRGMRHINVDRAAGAASYRAAVTALKAGEVVGVFPEATVSRTYELGPFKSGAVRMARDAGVPLLPTAVWGSQRVWTKGRPRQLGRHRIPVHVYVGEPLVVPRGGDVEAAAVELRRRMSDLLHQAQEAYEDRPASPEDGWWLPARLGGSAPAPDLPPAPQPDPAPGAEGSRTVDGA